MDFNEFKTSVLSYANEKGFEDCELYFSSGDSFGIMVLNQEVSSYEVSREQGVGFRGLYNGNIGYSYSECVDQDAVNFLVDKAFENSQILINETKEELFPGEPRYEYVNGFNSELHEVSENEIIEKALLMEKSAKAFDEKIVAVEHCMISYGTEEIGINNTKSLNKDFKRNNITAYISVIAKDGECIKTGGEYYSGNKWCDFDYEKVAQNAAKAAVNHLNAKSIKSGKYKTLLKNEVMSDILATFSGVFYGENVEKGFSLLKGKKEGYVASGIVTLRDDGLLIDGLSSYPFDSEGVACKNKVIIENGILKTYLHNIKSAKKMGEESTGNGFKASFKGSVQTSCTNFYIENGSISEEEILNQIGNGVYITEVAGLHSGTNTISGDFSLSAEGFMIEDGKVSYPIEQITIAGNFFELLLGIKSIGNDLRFGMAGGKGCFGSPMVYVNELSISGE